ASPESGAAAFLFFAEATDPVRINVAVNKMPIARLGLMRRPRWLCSKARDTEQKRRQGWGERFYDRLITTGRRFDESRLHHPYIHLHRSTRAWTGVEK